MSANMKKPTKPKTAFDMFKQSKKLKKDDAVAVWEKLSDGDKDVWMKRESEKAKLYEQKINELYTEEASKMSALNLYQLEVQIKNAQATKKSEQITAKTASKNWVNLPVAEIEKYEKNCKNVEHVVSMMKNLDEAKDSKKTKPKNVSPPPKEEPKKKVEVVEETVKEEVKAEKKTTPKVAPVKKEEPPTEKTPK